MKKEPLKVLVYMPAHVKSNRDMLQGILQHAEQTGLWEIDVIGISEEYEKNAIRDFGELDGAICYADKSAIAGKVRDLPIPVIAVFPDAPAFTTPTPGPRGSVICNSAPIGRAAAQFLANRSPASFLFVGSKPSTDWSHRRCEGFLKELRKRNKDAEIFCLTGESSDVIKLSEQLAGLKTPIAVLAENDRMARTVLSACRKANLAVPNDVWILGVDNDELLCNTANPPLSSIAMDARATGERAAKALHTMMRNRRSLKRPLGYTFDGVVERLSSAKKAEYGALAERAAKCIEKHIERDLGSKAYLVADVVTEIGVSRRSLEMEFRKQTGRSLHDEIIRMQLKKATRLLMTGKTGIDEIASKCGFSSSSHFSSTFRRQFGRTPSEARKRFAN